MLFQNKQEDNAPKQTQESFESFCKSEMWRKVCMINEIGDFLDIVIRNEEDSEYKCLCGVCWTKAHFTPEQVDCIKEKQRQLEQQKSWNLLKGLLPKAYQWGIYEKDGDCGMHMDGFIRANSPEDAERKLRHEHCKLHSTITVFY